MLPIVALLAVASSPGERLAACAVMNATGCTMSPYTTPTVADAAACCAACASDPKCEAWTFHGAHKGGCYIDSKVDCRAVASAVGGCKKPPCHSGPPPPGPPGPPPPPAPPPVIPFKGYCKTAKGGCRNVLYFVAVRAFTGCLRTASRALDSAGLAYHTAGRAAVIAARSRSLPASFLTLAYHCHCYVQDDMRSDWGVFGLPTVTPNLDKLAKKSMLFEHTYCQLSVCAPSRMSFMTSRRPDTFQVWNFIDTVPPNTTQATPGHFRDHDFITLGAGKTFHQASGAWNVEKYWSLNEQPYFPYGVGRCPHGGQGGGHCVQKDEEIYDYHLRLKAIDYLKYATNSSAKDGRPWYLMVGFRKPHAPWQAPQRMYDLYDESKIEIAKHTTLPIGTNQIAWSNQLSVQLENGTGFRYDPYNAVPDWVTRDQRHAYYASVSYVDEHVGYIMETLSHSPQQEANTVILFHADHGYHLGEHGEWEKKSCFDLVVRVPLMIHVPGAPHTWGTRTSALVELVDVFPTVAALAGLPIPAGVDGEDQSALFAEPGSAAAGKTGKVAAYHQYPACGMDVSKGFNVTRGACNNAEKHTFNYMGYTVRTADWRYTAWFIWQNATLTADFAGPHASELYAHTGDHSYEMDNYENEVREPCHHIDLGHCVSAR